MDKDIEIKTSVTTYDFTEIIIVRDLHIEYRLKSYVIDDVEYRTLPEWIAKGPLENVIVSRDGRVRYGLCTGELEQCSFKYVWCKDDIQGLAEELGHDVSDMAKDGDLYITKSNNNYMITYREYTNADMPVKYLIAAAWKNRDVEEGTEQQFIVFNDGNQFNISADNIQWAGSDKYEEYIKANNILGRREYGATAKITRFVRYLEAKETRDQVKEEKRVEKEKEKERKRADKEKAKIKKEEKRKAMSADVDALISNLDIPTSFSL